MSVTRYPLAWPAGWPRTRSRRKTTAFKVTYERALSDLDHEISRLGGILPILSTNYEVRLDGSLRRSVPDPTDPGAAVYFEHKGKQKVFACDTFTTVLDNIRGIGLTIECLRRIDRYGASAMMERALQAFEALPAPLDPWQILGLERSWILKLTASAGKDAIDRSFHALAKMHHPDTGGSQAKMAELNRARELALEALEA